MWYVGGGVNGCLKQWVYFAWALFWNEFAFLVEALDVVLFVGDKEVWVI